MKTKLVLVLLGLGVTVFGQGRDNIWMMGRYGALIPYNFYYKMDFSFGSPDTIVEYRKMPMWLTNASICDASGNLLFYTNGTWVANKLGDTLLNSQGFNPGWATNYYFNQGSGLPQSAIVLPFNDTSSLYYLVHESAEYFTVDSTTGQTDMQPLNLMYSVVDAGLDNGNGAFVPTFKNQIVISDTLINGRITACKHANGRDWWVITHKYNSDIYYKFLFTPTGIMGPFIQQIGSFFPPIVNTPQWADDFDIFGMACFSPDGSKYIQVGPSRIMELLDFDRCTGNFSNSQTIHIPINPGYNWALGCSFSPDSRFIYTNTYLRAYQYDTYASLVDSARTLVAVYDSFLDPFDTWFSQNQIGPDGKIYVSTFSTSFSLHVIESPNTLGVSCNFNQHSYRLPSNNIANYTVPNFPNYRLGRLVGSLCDTLTSAPYLNPPQRGGLKIISNPNNGNFIINYSLPQNTSGILQIFDVMGKQVYKQMLPQWSIMQRLTLTTLPEGMYVAKVASGEWSSVIKFIIE